MRYAHDCARCMSLGQWKAFDLYFCPAPDATVLARYGDDDHEYMSGLPIAALSPALAVAEERATVAGLLPKEEPCHTTQ